MRDSSSRPLAPHDIARIRNYFGDAIYILFDDSEPSDLPFFALLSHNLCIAKGTSLLVPFGGMNIIIAADFTHPPEITVCRNHPSLYTQGRAILSNFMDVVMLRDPIRTVDQSWRAVLQRIRFGRMDDKSCSQLRSLTLPGPGPVDVRSISWTTSTVVTDHAATRQQWNTASLRAHYLRTGNPVYICHAKDTIGIRSLTDREQFFADRLEISTDQLEVSLALSVGMPVMVELSLQMEPDWPFDEIHDVSFAQIIGITLHPADTTTAAYDGVVSLKRLPQSIQLRDHAKSDTFTITPTTDRGYWLRHPMPVTTHLAGPPVFTTQFVTRSQYAVKGAYAISNDESDGEPNCTVIADISKCLSAREAYTILSRASHADHIRLLHDFDNSLFLNGFDDESHIDHRRMANLHRLTFERLHQGRDVRCGSAPL